MAAAQLMLPANRAFNSNGIGVPGAVAKLFASGTTTPANFYFDSDLSVSLGSEITANGAGRFSTAYQDNATPWRLIIEDADGVELEDIDPFYFGQTAITVNSTARTPQQYGAVGDGTTDDTAAIQAALDAINDAGGGVLYFPEGTYKVTAYLTVYPYTTIRGAGNKVSKLTTAIAGGGGANAHENLRNGCIFHSVQAINSSTRVNIYIENLWLHCSNGSNVGAGYYDRGGTFIGVRRVRIDGFKYGIVFDQSELADIDQCDFESQVTGGLWLVNGAELSAGADPAFTNRIAVSRSQFNQGAAAYGIIDDGGYSHAYTDNNYNGCLNHIRAAAVIGLKISGGEFESATGACIRFESTTLATTAAGNCNVVYIGAGAMLVPVAGQNCITAIDLDNIVLDSVYFGSTAVAKYAGSANTNAIYAFNCLNAGGGATFDGRATNHYEFGYNGTDFKTRTNQPIEMGGTVVIDASRNTFPNTIELGHASDTTLSRVSAGVVAIEGVNIVTTATNKPTESLIVACSDETTALTTGTAKITFRMPYAFTLSAVRASLTTAQASGSIFTVDINEGGTTILSTKLTIDNTEKTSTTAATAVVISDSSLADDAEITVDIDQVGDGTAKGLKVYLIGTRT